MRIVYRSYIRRPSCVAPRRSRLPLLLLLQPFLAFFEGAHPTQVVERAPTYSCNAPELARRRGLSEAVGPSYRRQRAAARRLQAPAFALEARLS
jgi:hypothetical protein